MITDLIARQRVFYNTGATRSYGFRMEALSKLKEAILRNKSLLFHALEIDLNKSAYETYLCEIGIVLDEIRFHQKHLRKWMRKQRVRSVLGQFPGHCFQFPEPYGTTLILAPWNYPVNLCFMPLIGAISGGNTALVSPSVDAPASSAAIAQVLSDAFPPEYIAVVGSGNAQNTALLRERFDYIFFTGSIAVGKVVMEAAAKHLTPVTLELGGKNPVIVDENANLRLAARRIAFGKTINAGQTCVAPDYLLIHEQAREAFLRYYRHALSEFFPDEDRSQMVTIISKRHYDRLKTLLREGHVILGGDCDDERRYIGPTIIEGLSFDAPIMQEEIFGPILPLFSYRDIRECVDYITSQDKPLALYLFSKSREQIQAVLERCSFGGGCVNDTLIHLANPRLPFGGVGASGIGSYHGKKSFDTFTHMRSVLCQSGKIDVPLRYMPFTKGKFALIRKIMR